MKSLSTILFLVILLLPITSCRNNRLKTNEKELAKEILIQEKENVEAERIAREKKSETKKSFQAVSGKRKSVQSILKILQFALTFPEHRTISANLNFQMSLLQ